MLKKKGASIKLSDLISSIGEIMPQMQKVLVVNGVNGDGARLLKILKKGTYDVCINLGCLLGRNEGDVELHSVLSELEKSKWVHLAGITEMVYLFGTDHKLSLNYRDNHHIEKESKLISGLYPKKICKYRTGNIEYHSELETEENCWDWEIMQAFIYSADKIDFLQTLDPETKVIIVGERIETPAFLHLSQDQSRILGKGEIRLSTFVEYPKEGYLFLWPGYFSGQCQKEGSYLTVSEKGFHFHIMDLPWKFPGEN